MTEIHAPSPTQTFTAETCIRAGPDQIAAVISAAAFDVPGGLDVRVELLYRLENEFGDWSEHLIGRLRKRAFVFTITKLRCPAQVAKAQRLFWEAIAALNCLPASSATPLRRGPRAPFDNPTTSRNGDSK